MNAARALAEAFAAQVRRWAREAGAAEPAARLAAAAARAVSEATGAGHVCLHLAAIDAGGRPAAELRAQLLASGVVGTPEARDAMPLILDGDDRLYLHRYFDYECRLARCLTAAPLPAPADGPQAPLAARLRGLFAGSPAAGDPADWQQVAVAMALLGRLTVISGGPGTGKTTTVVNLLACLLEADPGCRIALAAPTGKAAARLTEAIRQRAGHLPEPLRARLPGAASTIHRLLGVRPDGSFRHHPANRLAIDALIVDEASMLDLALATRLLEAVPETARIVLLGDKDQLAAVESGAVFAELSADPGLGGERLGQLARLCGLPPDAIRPPAGAATGCPDRAVWLTRNFRFAGDSGIGRLAAAINGGDGVAATARLRAGEPDLAWFEDGGRRLGEAASAALLAGYEDYLATLGSAAPDPTAVTEAFARCRVLCALREGPRGVEAINELLGQQVRRRLDLPPERDDASRWYPGRPVMILRNDYVLRLFNGDVGIALPGPEGALLVHFPAPDGGFRTVAPLRLPEHETAFAMTIHKSQGSEFERVLLVLPAEPAPVLTRELLYTGITRARRQAALIGSETILQTAIATATQRHSGLLARLREAAGGG